VTIKLRDLLTRKGDPLQLEPLTGELGLDRFVPDAEVASPGLALAGYVGRFAPRRLHVLGETEITSGRVSRRCSASTSRASS
jgi:serine kinase of HPr protein (carbohydrate metabolism regulator)